MTLRIAQWTLDVHDAPLMAAFWSEALGYRVDPDHDGGIKLYPPDDAGPDVLTLWLQVVGPDERKAGKNRNHLDLRPGDGDVEAEVTRLLALGARRVDVGQPDRAPFVVLADPEGNELCVLRNEPR